MFGNINCPFLPTIILVLLSEAEQNKISWQTLYTPRKINLRSGLGLGWSLVVPLCWLFVCLNVPEASVLISSSTCSNLTRNIDHLHLKIFLPLFIIYFFLCEIIYYLLCGVMKPSHSHNNKTRSSVILLTASWTAWYRNSSFIALHINCPTNERTHSVEQPTVVCRRHFSASCLLLGSALNISSQVTSDKRKLKSTATFSQRSDTNNSWAPLASSWQNSAVTRTPLLKTHYSRLLTLLQDPESLCRCVSLYGSQQAL